MKPPPLLLPLLLLCACEEYGAGLRALGEGRHRDALEAFTTAELAAGPAAPAALVYDRALAALLAGDLRVAELSAEKAAARGGPRFTALRDFLLGNAAWVRSTRAEAETTLQDADPTAFARAIAHARQARDHWRAAAASRADWPAARRNAERAQRRLQELERRKQEAEERERQKAGRTEEQPVQEPEQTPPDQPTEEVEQHPVAQQAGVTDDALARLLAKLEQIEKDKRALRRANREARDRAVERDW